MTALELLALLIFCHFVADYPMQGHFVAMGKNRMHPLPGTPWYQILLAHAVMHGGMVAGGVALAAFSGHPELFPLVLPMAVSEAVCHWLIDSWKCRREVLLRDVEDAREVERARILAYNIDQALHFSCKVLWTGVCFAVAAMPLVLR